MGALKLDVFGYFKKLPNKIPSGPRVHGLGFRAEDVHTCASVVAPRSLKARHRPTPFRVFRVQGLAF